VRSSLRHPRPDGLAAALEGRDADVQLAKQGVIAVRVATRQGTPEGDGARRRPRSDRAREATTEGAVSCAVPGAAKARSADTVPAETRILCHTEGSGGTKGAEG
jgi:hypothetical protein